MFDAVFGFSMAELDEAGELAIEAKSEGSLGDQSGEPQILANVLRLRFMKSAMSLVRRLYAGFTDTGEPTPRKRRMLDAGERTVGIGLAGIWPWSGHRTNSEAKMLTSTFSTSGRDARSSFISPESYDSVSSLSLG